MSPLAWTLMLPVRFYRRCISPLKRPCCRFVPTCSTYALEALAKHGAVRGSLLTLRRVCRCHPYGGSGHDPVPTAVGRVKRLPSETRSEIRFGHVEDQDAIVADVERGDAGVARFEVTQESVL